MNREFKIKQIFLKDVSFQAPSGAAAFSQEWSPQVKVDLKVDSEPLGNNLYDVSLRLSVLSRTGTNTHFMIEVVQGGVFSIVGYDEAKVHQILHTVCPDTLYPYARETIDGLIVKARFPTLLLDPVDFGATYAAR